LRKSAMSRRRFPRVENSLGVPEVLRLGALCSGLHPERKVLDMLSIPCKTVWSVEKDTSVARLQQAIHGCAVHCEDIFKIDKQTLAPVDIVTAGFPCQPFSLAGKGLGVNDDNGRGLVIHEIIKIIAHTSPRLIILENVMGLLRKHVNLLKEIKRELQNFGYLVSVHKYCGSSSIIPHSRPRVWILCFHKTSVIHYYEDFKPLLFQPKLRSGYINLSWRPGHCHFNKSKLKTLKAVHKKVEAILRDDATAEVFVDIDSSPWPTNRHPNICIVTCAALFMIYLRNIFLHMTS